MEQRFALGEHGTLLVTQEGLRVRLEARRPADGKGLYKVWLLGARGARLLLGTMIPEDGALCLRRVLSRSELERNGCWPPVGAEAPLAFPFAPNPRWYCEPNPRSLVSDPLLRSQIPGSMLCLREKDGFRLAVPLRPGCPLPLSGLFCLARPERLDGTLHLVWFFDASGEPRLPDDSSP